MSLVYGTSCHKNIGMALYRVLYGGHVGCLYIRVRQDKYVITKSQVIKKTIERSVLFIIQKS